MCVACVVCVYKLSAAPSSAQVGAGLVLETAARPGVRGAIQDLARLLGGMRQLGAMVGGLALLLPPAVTLCTQSILLLLVSNTETYCERPVSGVHLASVLACSPSQSVGAPWQQRASQQMRMSAYHQSVLLCVCTMRAGRPCIFPGAHLTCCLLPLPAAASRRPVDAAAAVGAGQGPRVCHAAGAGAAALGVC
jgi:hypothetical protein